MTTPHLDSLVALAAGGGGAFLPKSAENAEDLPSAEDLAGAHDHLRGDCRWYKKVSAGEPAADCESHCQPAKHTGEVPRLVVKGTGEVPRLVVKGTDELLDMDQLFLTPRTPEASTVVQPTVPPGGPGLFHIKGEHLPPYVEHLYKHLVGRYGKKKAYGVAIGVVKKWAAGINPGGKHPTHTHADVRAAAAKNVAQWEASKAKAHARHGSKSDHALAATAALSMDQPPSFPGSEVMPMGPVPAGKVPRAMFTAHRLDDILRHLAHSAERLNAAKQSKALRAHHMVHVSNHLTKALETGYKLIENMHAHYPAESREFRELNKTMLLAKSTSPEAKAATFAHLLQTVMYDQSHAKRHADCMQKLEPEDEWRFNWDHAASHVDGALSHAFKLAHHVRDNYPDENKYLRELDRIEDPEDLYTGLTSSGPDKTKAQASYGPAESKTRRCGTCSMFQDGHCSLVKGEIEADHVCRWWEKKDAKVELARPKNMITAPGAMYDVVAPAPGGKFSTYGLHQHPSQTVSPSPPLPPKVPIPTPEEVRKLIAQVPECEDVSLSNTVKKFLEDAARKLERDSPLDALAALRAATHATIPAHKADLSKAMPSIYTAAVFTRVPPAAQSSATSEMKQSRDRTLQWRTLQKRIHALADRLRKRFFHGVFSGPNQMARMTEDSPTALEKVLLARRQADSPESH